jgi:3-oxosteroid 1-dehydrogenase
VAISRRTALRELLVEDGRVVGVRATRDGSEIAIRARHGVLLNAGGFARNPELRERFGPHPASTDWTATIPGDTGDAFTAATAIGAATTNLDAYYWVPGLMDKDGHSEIFIAERAQPHTILVDATGARFADEAKSYMELGNDQYARTPAAVPAYLVLDTQHRNRYLLGQTLPRVSPKAWLASGHLTRADTLADLAHACGIDPHGLEKTVERFNRMALAGVDEDFERGNTAHDRVYGDPKHRPNPCLGTIEKPPFYAARMFPTDVGCAGGLHTDEHARVLSTDGGPIPGLYASGTTAASAMGNVYAGGGQSLGQSSVFGLIAAEQITAHAGATVPAS